MTKKSYYNIQIYISKRLLIFIVRNKRLGFFGAQQAKYDIVLLLFVDMMKILNFPLFSAKIKIPGKDDLTFFQFF